MGNHTGRFWEGGEKQKKAEPQHRGVRLREMVLMLDGVWLWLWLRLTGSTRTGGVTVLC